jgi:hypothetical protein
MWLYSIPNLRLIKLQRCLIYNHMVKISRKQGEGSTHAATSAAKTIVITTKSSRSRYDIRDAGGTSLPKIARMRDDREGAF